MIRPTEGTGGGPSRRAVAALVAGMVLVALAAGGLGLAGTGAWAIGAPGESASGSPSEASVSEGPEAAVDADAVARAVATRPPSSRTMSDEIAHFRARLAARGGDEAFSRRRLVAAHMLRFRAYGSPDDLDAARRHLAALSAGSAPSPELLSLRASVALVAHDFRGALESARRANRLAGDYDPGLRLRLFDALWATGSYGAAEDLLGLPHERGSFDYLVREARVLDRKGETERARENLRAAVIRARAYAEPAPVVAWALTELGHFEHHTGRPVRAVRRYLEALEVVPGSPAPLTGLADVAWGVDRNADAASALLTRALELGAHPETYLDLANVEEAQGHAEEAEALRRRFLDAATRDEATEAQHLRPLALVLADTRPDRLDEALAYARRDLDARPTSESWGALAWVHFRRGEVEAARRAAQRATAWGRPEPLVLYHAGVVADAAGDRVRAEELLEGALEGAVELEPDQVERARALRGRP